MGFILSILVLILFILVFIIYFIFNILFQVKGRKWYKLLSSKNKGLAINIDIFGNYKFKDFWYIALLYTTVSDAEPVYGSTSSDWYIVEDAENIEETLIE